MDDDISLKLNVDSSAILKAAQDVQTLAQAMNELKKSMKVPASGGFAGQPLSRPAADVAPPPGSQTESKTKLAKAEMAKLRESLHMYIGQVLEAVQDSNKLITQDAKQTIGQITSMLHSSGVGSASGSKLVSSIAAEFKNMDKKIVEIVTKHIHDGLKAVDKASGGSGVNTKTTGGITEVKLDFSKAEVSLTDASSKLVTSSDKILSAATKLESVAGKIGDSVAQALTRGITQNTGAMQGVENAQAAAAQAAIAKASGVVAPGFGKAAVQATPLQMSQDIANERRIAREAEAAKLKELEAQKKENARLYAESKMQQARTMAAGRSVEELYVGNAGVSPRNIARTFMSQPKHSVAELNELRRFFDINSKDFIGARGLTDLRLGTDKHQGITGELSRIIKAGSGKFVTDPVKREMAKAAQDLFHDMVEAEQMAILAAFQATGDKSQLGAMLKRSMHGGFMGTSPGMAIAAPFMDRSAQGTIMGLSKALTQGMPAERAIESMLQLVGLSRQNQQEAIGSGVFSFSGGLNETEQTIRDRDPRAFKIIQHLNRRMQEVSARGTGAENLSVKDLMATAEKIGLGSEAKTLGELLTRNGEAWEKQQAGKRLNLDEFKKVTKIERLRGELANLVRIDAEGRYSQLESLRENVAKTATLKYEPGSPMSDFNLEARGIAQFVNPGAAGQMAQPYPRWRQYGGSSYQVRGASVIPEYMDPERLARINEVIARANMDPTQAAQLLEHPVYRSLWRNQLANNTTVGEDTAASMVKLLGGKKGTGVNKAFFDLEKTIQKTTEDLFGSENKKGSQQFLEELWRSGAGVATLEQVGDQRVRHDEKLRGMLKARDAFMQMYSGHFKEAPWGTKELMGVRTEREQDQWKLTSALTNLGENPNVLFGMLSGITKGEGQDPKSAERIKQLRDMAQKNYDDYMKSLTKKDRKTLLSRPGAQGAIREAALAEAMMQYDILGPRVEGLDKSRTYRLMEQAKVNFKNPAVAMGFRDLVGRLGGRDARVGPGSEGLYAEQWRWLQDAIWGSKLSPTMKAERTVRGKSGEWTTEPIQRTGVGEGWRLHGEYSPIPKEVLEKRMARAVDRRFIDPLILQREARLASLGKGSSVETSNNQLLLPDVYRGLLSKIDSRLAPESGITEKQRANLEGMRKRTQEHLERSIKYYGGTVGGGIDISGKKATTLFTRESLEMSSSDFKEIKDKIANLRNIAKKKLDEVAKKYTDLGMGGQHIAVSKLEETRQADMLESELKTRERAVAEYNRRREEVLARRGTSLSERTLSRVPMPSGGGMEPPKEPPKPKVTTGGGGDSEERKKAKEEYRKELMDAATTGIGIPGGPIPPIGAGGGGGGGSPIIQILRQIAANTAVVARAVGTGKTLFMGGGGAGGGAKEGLAYTMAGKPIYEGDVRLSSGRLIERANRGLSRYSATKDKEAAQKEASSRSMALTRISAEEEQSSLGNKLQSDGAITTAMRRGLIWGGTSMVIYQAAGAMRSFLDTVVKMDKQLIDLRKTLGGTEKDFTKLADSAMNTARATGASTQDVLDAVELFSKQFKRPEDLSVLSKSAALFGNLSGQNIQTSVETLTSAIEQYNLSVSQAEGLTDSWAAMAASANVTIKDLGDAFGSAAGPAKEAGVTMHELNAIVATISATTGKSGKEIGTGLKRMFERVSSPENEKKLAAEGIRTRVIGEGGSLEARNFIDILEDLRKGVVKGGKGWDDMTASQKRHIAVLIAGARQYDGFIALMNNYTKVQDLVTASQNSSGSATEQNDRLMTSLSKKFQLLKTEIDSMARSVGSVLVPAMSGLVGVLTQVLSLISRFPKLSMAVGAVGIGMGLKGIGDLVVKGALTKNIGGIDVFKSQRVGQFVSQYMDQPPIMGANGTYGFHDSSRLSGGKILRGTAMDITNKFGISGMFGREFYSEAEKRRGDVENKKLISTGQALSSIIGGVTSGLLRLATATAILWLAFEGISKIVEYFGPSFKKTFIDSSKEMIDDINQSNKQSRQQISANRSFSMRAQGLAIEAGALSEIGMSGQRKADLSTQITGLLDDAVKTNPDLERFFSRDEFGSVKVDSNIVESLKAFSEELDKISRQDAIDRLVESFRKLGSAVDEVTGKTGSRADTGAYFAQLFTGEAFKKMTAGIQRGLKNEDSSMVDEAVTVGALVERAAKNKTNLRRQLSSGTISDFISRTGGIVTMGGKEGSAGIGDVESIAKRMTAGYALGDVLKQDILENRDNLRKNIEDLLKKESPNLKGGAREKRINELLAFNENEKVRSARERWVNDTIRPWDTAADKKRIEAEAAEYFKRPDVAAARDRRNGVLATDLTRDLRAKVSDFEPMRIDYALNKSLTSNFRNARDLGFYQSNFLQNTLGAFDQAISDLNNNIEMAASSQEESAMRLRDQQLIDKREARSSALKDYTDAIRGGMDPSKAKEGVEELHGDVMALRTHKQAIQEENDERRKLKEELMSLREVIKTISVLDQVIRPAFKSNLASTLTRGETISDAKLQAHTDEDYIDKQIAREEEMQRRGGYANTARGRNALRALRDQKREIQKNRQKTIDQNDFFRNLTKDTGQSMFGSMTGLLTDQLFESGYASIFGEAGKGMAGLNPVANILQYERKSLDYLRQIADNTKVTGNVLTGSIMSGGVSGVSGAQAGGGLAAMALASPAMGAIMMPDGLTSDEQAAWARAHPNSAGVPGGRFGKLFNGRGGMALMAAMSGGAMGNQITASQGKTGLGGTIGGALGAAGGALLGAQMGTAMGPVGMAIGGLAGGLLGALFDKPKEPELKDLPEIEEEQLKELRQISKNINTVNDTMENLINAPSNFTLPIPKGILENSITAQSALATPLQSRGLIIKSGPAYLHAGEKVVDGGYSGGGAMNISNSITINGANKDPKEIANEVANVLSQKMYTDSQRIGGYRGRF